MVSLAVDPEALFAAGSAVVAAGDGLAANLTVLTAGFAANTGHDVAGEVFGLGYQDAAGSLLKAAAAAINACRHCGALIQQGASNYSRAEAASTLGGGGGVLQAPAEPGTIAAPGPPGTWGPGSPPPLLWDVVESFVDDVWPDGDVPGLHAAAARWRGFGAAAAGMRGALNASKSLFDAQQIPEGAKIDEALSQIGNCIGDVGEQCGKLASSLDGFADEVDHAQNAIRDLLHRVGSLANPVHDVMLIFEGDAIEEIKKIARDINDVLHNLGREARAFEQGIKLVMQVGDGLVVKFEKFMRGQFTQFLGEEVGNPVATVFDTWVNANEGVVKGAVGMVEGIADLDPRWFLFDPKGAAATWSALGKSLWKGSLINSFLNPQEAGKTDLQMLKSLLHLDDWSTARPGLGFGENLFDVATLFVPGAGEAGAAADGAGAAARGAEAAEAAGAAGRAERAAGELGEIAGVRGALADISKTSGDLSKNLEGLTGDLPKIEPAPVSGSPVGLPPGKPLEAPVEATPHPPDAAPGASEGPTAATGATPHESPGPGGGPHEPVSAPPVNGPHDPAEAPVPAPAGGTHEPMSAPAAAGPHNPIAAPVEPSHAHAPQSGPPAETSATPAAAGPHEPMSPPAEGPREPASGSGPHEPASVPAGGPHDPAPESSPHDPASVPAEGSHEPVFEPPGDPQGPAPERGPGEPGSVPTESPHEPTSTPASGAPLSTVPAAVGERAPLAIPQVAEHSPPRVLATPSGTPTEPAPVAAHAPRPTPAAKPGPHAPAAGGRPSELPMHGAGPRGPGDGGPPGSRPKPPQGGPFRPGDDDPLDGRQSKLTPRDDTPHEPRGEGANNDHSADSGYHQNPSDSLSSDDLSAMADYTGTGYLDLNDALRSTAVDASQHARIDAISNALQKLPMYRGTVTRGTDLPPEVLAQYRPGEVITEKAFLSTTTNPAVARSTAFTGNVEFRIFSNTGRDISSVSLFPDEREILFPAGTHFYIVDKTIDPLTGKTIIEMIERLDRD